MKKGMLNLNSFLSNNYLSSCSLLKRKEVPAMKYASTDWGGVPYFGRIVNLGGEKVRGIRCSSFRVEHIVLKKKKKKTRKKNYVKAICRGHAISFTPQVFITVSFCSFLQMKNHIKVHPNQ